MIENIDMNKLVETIKATMYDMNHSEDFPVRVACISQYQHTSEAWIIQLLIERDRIQKLLTAIADYKPHGKADWQHDIVAMKEIANLALGRWENV